MKRFQVTVNGNAYDVQVQEVAAGATAAAPAQAAPAPVAAAAAPAAAAPAAAPKDAAPAGAVSVKSPMPGNILDVKTSVGATVNRGDVLLVLEAMKMENDITAPSAGTVAAIHVKKGDSVDTGTLLVSIN